MDQVAIAKSNGDKFVETSKEIIHHYNRKGLNGAKYFTYDGVLVCEYGKMDEVQKELDEQMGQKVFGSSEGTVNG